MVSRSYRMTADNGNAPCPFDNLKQVIQINQKNADNFDNDLLTLSTCGSKLRHLMSEGEWVFSIAANKFGEKANKLIWVGKVNRITSKGEYFRERNSTSKYDKESRPDNYYAYESDVKSNENILDFAKGKDSQGLKDYAIFDNPYHGIEDKKRDLYNPNFSNVNRAITLWFNEWWYFGKNAIEIKEELRAESVEAKKLDEKEVDNFINELRSEYPEKGIYGAPMSIDMGASIGCEEKAVSTSCDGSRSVSSFTGGSWREYLKWWYKNKL